MKVRVRTFVEGDRRREVSDCLRNYPINHSLPVVNLTFVTYGLSDFAVLNLGIMIFGRSEFVVA